MGSRRPARRPGRLRGGADQLQTARPAGVSWHVAAEQHTEPVQAPVAGQPIMQVTPLHLTEPSHDWRPVQLSVLSAAVKEMSPRQALFIVQSIRQRLPLQVLVAPQLSAPEQVIWPVAAWLSTPPAHVPRPAHVTWHVVPPHVMGPAHD